MTRSLTISQYANWFRLYYPGIPLPGFYVSFNRDGYVMICARVGNKNLQRAAHRILMEIHLGRRLKREEFVHHINHIRSDNRPGNLQTVSPGDHRHLHTIPWYEKPEIRKRWDLGEL